MWFQTTQKINISRDKPILFSPTKVLEVWQCKKCYNVIYQRKYTYSPFDQNSQKQYREVSLQNVIVQLKKCSHQNFMKIRSSDEKLKIQNKAQFYCKYCDDQRLLGQFKLQFCSLDSKIHYSMVPLMENIKIAKITMSKSNKKELSQKQSEIIGLNKDKYLTNIQRLKKMQKLIQKYLMLWFHSKNFNLYSSFATFSQMSRQNILQMKSVIEKMNSNNSKDEEKNRTKNRIKFMNFDSHSSASLSLMI